MAKPKKKAPTVRVDRQLKLLWQESIERLKTSRQEESVDWDAKWEAVADILDHDPPLYLAGGYQNAREFLARELPGEDERSVRRKTRVARSFSPGDEEKYGETRLAELLDYLEAANGGALPRAKIALARQKIRIRDGKKTKTIDFADATSQQIRAAAQAARGGKSDGARRDAPIVVALRSILAKRGIRRIGIRERNRRITLTDVALDKLPALGKALSSIKPNTFR